MKKSPLKYNPNLVQAVTGAYESSGAMDRAVTQGLMDITYKTMQAVEGSIKKKKEDILSKGATLGVDVKAFTQEQVFNLTKFKDQYDDVASKLSKPFLSKDKKNELNMQLNKINQATGTYIKSVNHLSNLRADALDKDAIKSPSYNQEERMTWDRIASGDIAKESSGMVDFETGAVYMQDPYGNTGDRTNVLSWQPLKTIDTEWIKEESKIYNKYKDLAKDSLETSDKVESEIKEDMFNHYNTNPEAIWEHKDVKNYEFLDYLDDQDDFFDKLKQDNPSHVDDLEKLSQANDPKSYFSLLKDLSVKQDVSDYWINFRTQKALKDFQERREQIQLAEQESTTSKPEGNKPTYTSSQEEKYRRFINSFNSGDDVLLPDGITAKKGPDNNYYLYQTSSGQQLFQGDADTPRVVNLDYLINYVGLPDEYKKRLDTTTGTLISTNGLPG